MSSPDPAWYPNGVGDAVHACVDSMYRWGDAFLYVTSRYASGFPSGWTVLDPARMTVKFSAEKGVRVYRYGDRDLDEADVVQVSRNPRPGSLRGSSVGQAFGSAANALLAASDLGRTMMAEGVPNAVLKSQRKLTEEQAQKLQAQWVARTSLRRGAPAVLPPDIDFEQLSYSPQDLLLLDAQKFYSQLLAAGLGVPALFLNLPIEGGLNYQSPAMLGEHWWRFELSPLAATLESALSGQMLARGSYVEFDARATLEPTFKDLTDALGGLAKDGLITAEMLNAVLFGVRPGENATELFLTPPSAGASPAQQSSTVVSLRPRS